MVSYIIFEIYTQKILRKDTTEFGNLQVLRGEDLRYQTKNTRPSVNVSVKYEEKYTLNKKI